jgi:XRE family transcriptional regulator, stress-response regulator
MPDQPDPIEIGRRRRGALLRSVLGEALRRARLAQGRTLADVAVAARISLPYLSEVERGRKEVSSEVLAALCDALGIDLSDLLIAVVFQLTDDAARSVGVGRRVTIERTGTVAPQARRPGDTYALAA